MTRFVWRHDPTGFLTFIVYNATCTAFIPSSITTVPVTGDGTYTSSFTPTENTNLFTTLCFTWRFYCVATDRCRAEITSGVKFTVFPQRTAHIIAKFVCCECSRSSQNPKLSLACKYQTQLRSWAGQLLFRVSNCGGKNNLWTTSRSFLRPNRIFFRLFLSQNRGNTLSMFFTRGDNLVFGPSSFNFLVSISD